MRKETSPLVVVDIGARGGFDSRFEIFGDHVRCVGFEPDSEECERVRASLRDSGLANRCDVYPAALWRQKATLPLYIPHCPESTSVYRPNLKFFGRLPEPNANAVARESTVHATTLDEFELPHNRCVDLLKIDVEGAELAILEGSEGLLRDEVLAVIPEITFSERYEGQPFFADVDIFLRRRGFRLFDLKTRRWRRRRLTPEFDNLRVGQLVYGDALFLKDPIDCPEFCRSGTEAEKLLKLIAIAEYYSLPDYGLELVEWGVQKELIKPGSAARYTELLLANRIVAKHDFNQFKKQ